MSGFSVKIKIMANKYLVVDNSIIFSTNVEYHSELVPKQYKKIFGGGRFHIDDKEKKIYLYDTSHDYGRADYSEILRTLILTCLTERWLGYEFLHSNCMFLDEAIKKSTNTVL